MSGAAPPPGALKARTFTLGPYATNCYLLWREGGPDREAWIIDAGVGPAPIAAAVAELRLNPTRLLLTHAHPDHIAGADELRDRFPQMSVAIHQAEARWLSDPRLNLSALMGEHVTTRPADALLADGQSLRLEGVEFNVLHTPGHSPGGVSLHAPAAGLVIAGDTLFAGSIGRSDFPGSDGPTLERSIRERLYTLPGETAVLPGHGPRTTIAAERLGNPFVRG